MKDHQENAQQSLCLEKLIRRNEEGDNTAFYLSREVVLLMIALHLKQYSLVRSPQIRSAQPTTVEEMWRLLWSADSGLRLVKNALLGLLERS